MATQVGEISRELSRPAVDPERLKDDLLLSMHNSGFAATPNAYRNYLTQLGTFPDVDTARSAALVFVEYFVHEKSIEVATGKESGLVMPYAEAFRACSSKDESKKLAQANKRQLLEEMLPKDLGDNRKEWLQDLWHTAYPGVHKLSMGPTRLVRRAGSAAATVAVGAGIVFTAGEAAAAAPQNPGISTTDNGNQLSNASKNTIVPISPETNKIINNLNLSPDKKAFVKNLVAAVMTRVTQGAEINPEVVIAQGALESGWNTSTLSSKYNNMFGIKAGSGYTGKTVTMPTYEQDANGNQYTVQAEFRAHDSLLGSVDDYISLMNQSNFADAKACRATVDGFLNGLLNAVDPNSCDTILVPGAGAYATDKQYANKIKATINANDIDHIVALEMAARGIGPSGSSNSPAPEAASPSATSSPAAPSVPPTTSGERAPSSPSTDNPQPSLTLPSTPETPSNGSAGATDPSANAQNNDPNSLNVPGTVANVGSANAPGTNTQPNTSATPPEGQVAVVPPATSDGSVSGSEVAPVPVQVSVDSSNAQSNNQAPDPNTAATPPAATPAQTDPSVNTPANGGGTTETPPVAPSPAESAPAEAAPPAASQSQDPNTPPDNQSLILPDTTTSNGNTAGTPPDAVETVPVQVVAAVGAATASPETQAPEISTAASAPDQSTGTAPSPSQPEVPPSPSLILPDAATGNGNADVTSQDAVGAVPVQVVVAAAPVSSQTPDTSAGISSPSQNTGAASPSQATPASSSPAASASQNSSSSAPDPSLALGGIGNAAMSEAANAPAVTVAVAEGSSSSATAITPSATTPVTATVVAEVVTSMANPPTATPAQGASSNSVQLPVSQKSAPAKKIQTHPVQSSQTSSLQATMNEMATELHLSGTYFHGTSIENITLTRDSEAVLKALGEKKFGGYPASLRSVPLDAEVDPWTMYNRECVSYVMWKWYQTYGHTPMWGGGRGYAWKWARDAEAAGIPVDSTPAAGSVMQWGLKPGALHGGMGHVAFVEKVLPDGTVITTEYNSGGTGTFSIHVYPPSYLKEHADQVKYIHPKP